MTAKEKPLRVKRENNSHINTIGSGNFTDERSECK
jgi:hypothetical protein